jgi:predicted glycoside hydrolase/deacetylase ChbG (UPF0249 family)
MPSFPRLIVNADDFGLSAGVNAGILSANRSGIVTSASLMVRAPSAKAGVEAAREQPAMSIGLHLDLGEWKFERGEWVPRYQRAPLDDANLLTDEVSSQFAIFLELVGRNPTHVDSHQHAHRNEPLRSIVLAKAAELAIPVRHENSVTRYRGDFYGQDDTGDSYPERIDVAFLSALIESLTDGTTELCCHPAELVDFDSTYAAERIQELHALCDPAVTRAIETAGVQLISFSDIAPLTA